MENLTILEYAGKNIRFDDNGDRVWVSLTDMRKATNTRVDDWIDSEGTKFFLRELENSENNDIFRSIPLLNNEGEGVWAIDEAAIDFAAWCDRRFRLWVSRQIRKLITRRLLNLVVTPPQTTAKIEGFASSQSLSLTLSPSPPPFNLGEAIGQLASEISTGNRKISILPPKSLPPQPQPQPPSDELGEAIAEFDQQLDEFDAQISKLTSKTQPPTEGEKNDLDF